MLRPVSVFLIALSLFGQQPPTAEGLFEAELVNRLQSIDAALDGVLGVYVIDLTTGRAINYHGETVFAQASSIKIPILIELFRQAHTAKVQLNGSFTLTVADVAGGSGDLQNTLRNKPS